MCGADFMKTIVLTGGGSSGHVTPNIALLPGLKRAGYNIHYVGSRTGIEMQLIEREGVSYHSISTGKLRRYFDLKNFTDTFRVVDGFRQAFILLGKLKPSIVFSKGGFVSCPVVWAAWLRKIPVVIHESDITPGLTNKLSMPFARRICYTFPESEHHIPANKGVKTGMPIREGLLNGDRSKGGSSFYIIPSASRSIGIGRRFHKPRAEALGCSMHVGLHGYTRNCRIRL
jgi:UDP-N-acetylglucosamine--N-acetylmuramyl-(pentapeptide) pyrophosphoryl-undecaprenol N-acetylglucosamine transferase